MDAGFDKNQIISDYTAFLQALLPEIIGFCCYDSRAHRFWHEQSTGEITFPEQYDAVLRQVLGVPERAVSIGRVRLEQAMAYIVPLIGDDQHTLGALTVLLDPTVDLPTYESCLNRVQPAVRSLERELTLRYRLVGLYKQLSVRSAEENLLHQVEKLVHLRRPCEKTLAHILLLCRRFLSIRGAALITPERNLRLSEGETVKPVELALMLSDMTEQVSMASEPSKDSKNIVRFDAEADVLAMSVHDDKKAVIGLLALSGWKKSDFSQRRRKRIARYVVALIEDVIRRDYDSLTGMMSWSLFEAQLIEASQGMVGEHNFCLYFDIDQMHVINETFGRDAGDELLTSFARLLREQLGSYLTTRITGDRFATILVGVDIDRAREQAEEIARCFHELEYTRGDQILRPTVSIGIGPVAGASKVASAALAPAQVACQAAKERGRGRVELYQQGDASIIQRLDDIHQVGHIRSAIENNRMTLVAQPIVAIQPGKTAAYYYEVLVRLIDSDGAHVMPADFFSAAERYQLMEELDRWVVTETLQLLAARMGDFEDLSLRIAINLSGQSLGSEQFLPFVVEQIKTSGVPARMLSFEVTETVAVANLQRAQKFMHTLKDLGCRFSLDDFGTGLSSFAYLKLFPVDTLKIDGSFVRDITTNVTSQSVVAAIAEVARVMQLQSVAEYVQDEEAMVLLKDLGVTWGQGFLLGAPEPLAEKLDSLALFSGDAASILA
jgi:diguanylate cyclase (GGDEF)-like protein